jgi:acetolactate synthase I/II/III large subunit
VLVTSGPGATNAVTGLTDALMDSVPVVCLTGQVPTHLIGNDAFQEADTTGITRPCTKHNYLVKDIGELARLLHEAFYVAKSGRPGPVVVDLPKDVLFATGTYSGPDAVRHKTYRPQLVPDRAQIREAVAMVAAAQRPLFYGGGGLINAGREACAGFAELVRRADAPCTLTLMGLGAIPADDPHFLGMVGMHGTYEANLAMHECDLMIAVAARFDDRVTGRLSAFSPGSKKIHIDIDPSSINKNVHVDLAIVGDAGAAVMAMLAEWPKAQDGAPADARAEWWRRIETWRQRDCLRYDRGRRDLIKPQYALERLQALTRERDLYVTTEVGQHQMWAAQFLKFDRPRHWMTSGGLGTMGYGLPAAIGVQIAHPEALVIDVAGEASILMNIQEMSTAAQYRLPVKVFILNNQYMGMVRQWQELLHGGRYSESYTAALPDFVKLADAFGAAGRRVEKPVELDDAILWMLRTKGAAILDVAVDPAENCFPMIPSGAAHNEMLLGPEDEAEKPVSEEGMVLV